MLHSGLSIMHLRHICKEKTIYTRKAIIIHLPVILCPDEEFFYHGCV